SDVCSSDLLLDDVDQLRYFWVGEPAGDFIEQQDARSSRQAARQLEAFALQQAEAAGRPVRVGRQAGLLEDLGRDRITLGSGCLAAAVCRHQQVLETGHVLEW